ncbi:hypothetical protein GCM10010302_11130 [Streptomyces polychromogenes]|uniref:Uncharacterized protein n=1 Tax=Streptomyces polychromogenes TaxID=67342 RepID=A0ABP3EV02_9ACTN
MIDEAEVWDRCAALLPDADGDEVRVCWAIGEQEAGVEYLVDALLRHRVPIGEDTRAEISVVAEGWGMRQAVAGRLMDCPGDGRPAVLELVEGENVLAAVGHPALDGFLLIPWIRSTGSGRLLVRAHVEEPWGDLSLIPEYYGVLASEQGPVLRLFESFSAREALEELRGSHP